MKGQFWEYYLVRYLAGTIFGVLILFYLVQNFNHDIENIYFKNKFDESNVKYDIEYQIINFLFYSKYEFEGIKPEKLQLDHNTYVNIEKQLSDYETVQIKKNEVTVLSMIIITVAGFLYMYVSSMVILTLHTFRYLWFDISKQEKRIKLYNFYHVLSNIRASGRIKEDEKKDTIVNQFKKRRITQTEKSKLTQTENAWIADYVESYRHLREHGNAFGILISEIIFAGYLIITKFSVLFLVLWLLLGFFSWLTATSLEVVLKNKYKYLYEKEEVNKEKKEKWTLFRKIKDILIYNKNNVIYGNNKVIKGERRIIRTRKTAHKKILRGKKSLKNKRL
ncbi:hypothetical protein [Chengkuizengella axinellae]|uniref:Uncharacterized protein n=1 Tax=Chengkuizengella axinellae TaxID=3064388 RepID=A0ABT9J3H6_9BACL|nr:hypothetical protein [Chengkuizengella sp. 2205SS18-9]MDP5276175.1 hypothetical protein [Chengkuizengella sp. 2205SS18-9]